MAVRPVNTHPNSADILLRVSTDQQAGDTHYSLPSQLSACQAFAAARGWHVYSVQEDTITGETVNRPGFQAVLDHLAAGKVGRVIVYDVDRAGRDIFVGVTLLHACQEAGATLHIERMPDLELGTGSPTAHMHEMLFVMRLSQAAQELSSLRERTQRGRRERVRAGKPLIGPVPLFDYTFTYDDHGVKSGFMPDPIYAPIVQRIFAEVAAGVPLQHICDALNREGVPTRSRVGMAYAKPATRRKVARFWQHNAITAIIEHPAYHGAPAAMRNSLWREQVFDAETGQHRTRYHRGLRHGSEVTPLSTEVWPALVSPTLARQARERLMANQEEAKRRMDTRDREDALLCVATMSTASPVANP